ncbi:hypothetical protein KIW84_015784 [Lathyrus oleraceus]|uniref:WAT1-related protein n=1 Tax=Pisum sativum TaxID=3888 RepID=A0A9D5H104_PEA|nr:hypothetical protein KIW84_015784 [Pisum sativum]
MMKDSICNVLQGLKPSLLMVMVQIAFAGVNILYKLAVNDGMNLKIVVAYRFIFSTAFIAPLAFFIESGSLAQNFYLEALALTSPTFASAMANLIPAITFIMAVSFGMEKLNLRTKAGKAKIIGTMTGISGAMVLTFVKGIEINIGSFHLNLLHHQNGVVSAHSPQATISTRNTILGSLCALASSSSYALWLIIHAKMSEKYPTHYSSTALMSFWASLLSIVFALCFEREFSQWKLGWNIRLLTVAYAGIVVSGAMICVISWCVHMRGPLFASVFSPLMLVCVALASCTLLNEKLHLGSIIGAVLIVCGLYAVVWGKSKEMKKKNQLAPSQSTHEIDPVEIVVKPVVEDKSNHSNNNSHSSNLHVISDNEDEHVQNQAKEGV